MSCRPAGTPCTACGMCCDGTLYWRGRVEPGEEAQVVADGLTLDFTGEKAFFKQPCGNYDGTLCTIYERRYRVCQQFECALLRRFKAGDIGIDEALKTVATAKALRSSLVAALPTANWVGGRHQSWKDLDARMADLDAHQRRPLAELQLKILALDTYLQRWFRIPEEVTAPGDEKPEVQIP